VQKILYAVAALVALLLLSGLLLPRESRFVVSGTIDASPAAVFSLANDLRRLRLWSPASADDPDVRVHFSGPARGVGATVTWDGPVAGSGTQTIVRSEPYRLIETLINAGEAGESRTRMEITSGTGTAEVTWAFTHDYGFNLVGRYIGVLATGILRRDYQRGFDDLKDLAQGLPRADFSDLEVERVLVEPEWIAVKSTRSSTGAAAASAALGATWFEIQNFMRANDLNEAGAPLAIARGVRGAELLLDAAIPVSGAIDTIPASSAGTHVARSYGGPALRIRHVGPYRSLAQTHRKIAAYLAALDIERNGDYWESYVSDPAATADDKLLTYIYYPVFDQP
jgi:effector-binding domain-containing protein